MSPEEEKFLKQLRLTFAVEAGEHLQAIDAGLLELEKASASEPQAGIVERVFRAAHSLKGAARAVDFVEIESLCQSLEDMFSTWKRREKAPLPAALDKAHRTLDAIAAALSAPEASHGKRAAAPPSAPPPDPGPPADVLLDNPQASSSRTRAAERKAAPPEETVRITVAKLHARLVEAEEMLAVKLITGERAEEARRLARRFESWRKECAAAEPDARALRQASDRKAGGRSDHSAALSRLLEFFDWNLDYVKSFESKVAELTRSAQHDRHVVGTLVDDLLEDSRKLLVLPFGSVTASFPKLVRDLCRNQGKEADLAIRGGEVEIEKRILEEMKDPLIHLLRNCVDHGIETPDERLRRGKAPRATITISVTPVNGNKAQLLVSDDGAGIAVERVKASAVKRGLISADDARQLGEAQAQALIFQSEVSTSPIITQLSGRGLGLAIVREKAEKLGGEVSVESSPGVGTVFRIVVPLTRPTFRGILVEAAARLLVIPTAQVERVVRVRDSDIQTVEGRATISVEGRVLALVPLAEVLELPPAEREDTPATGRPVVVLGGASQRVAFMVDAVLDEQEVLVKPLAKPLSRVRNVSAATVLGSGRLAPILNVADLLKSARKAAAAPLRKAASTRPVETRAILVAEDSITSRMLIKGILEAAGYKVSTAVDGMEAFSLLRAEKFDLLVSDVEMPRLDGFDLTARIRADRKLAELPVVLVTALEAREDRERGIDVGADAYLVKSSFDQSDLLDAVRRLV